MVLVIFYVLQLTKVWFESWPPWCFPSWAPSIVPIFLHPHCFEMKDVSYFPLSFGSFGLGPIKHCYTQRFFLFMQWCLFLPIHYEKSHSWKPHYLATRDSYEITMQLNYNYLLKIQWFLFLKSTLDIIWVLL